MCRWTKVLACLAMMAVWVVPAAAQGYPVKPIRIIVPFPAAGTADIMARVVGQNMSETWGPLLRPSTAYRRRTALDDAGRIRRIHQS